MLASACRTTGGGSSASSAEAMSVRPSEGPEEEESGGYFVSLDARSTDKDAVFLYDKLHDAVNAQAKKRATAADGLEAYVEEYEQTGYTSLIASGNEIECDRDKCLVKLESRTVKGEPGQTSLAGELTAGLAESGIPPKTTGSGEGIVRTYVIETKAGKGIRCKQKGFGQGASYECKFDLDVKKAARTAEMNPASRGRLASCALSPGVVRSAEQAKGQIENGALLALTASPGGKAVGFLVYARQGAKDELIDLYLCGDVSHDYFQLDGPARDPKAWLATLDPARADEAELQLTARAVAESKATRTFEVVFKIVAPDGATPRSGELYGDDKFFVTFPRTWLP